MYAYSGMILAVLAVVFGVARYFRISTELSLLLAAFAGALVHGITHGVGSPRYIVDGAFTYLDICLIFMSATLFMNLLKRSGGVAYIIRAIIRNFHDRRALCLFFLAFVMLIPGALTGAGAVTCLIVGGLVGTVLTYMGVSQVRATAIVFVCAACSAAAPPINLWAMMAAAGANTVVSPALAGGVGGAGAKVSSNFRYTGAFAPAGTFIQYPFHGSSVASSQSGSWSAEYPASHS